MTSKLDERTTTQIPTQGSDRNESPAHSEPRTWRTAVAAAATVALGAGLVVAVARIDRAPSQANGPEPAAASSTGVNADGLPAHLSEFEGRASVASTSINGLPQHLQQIEALVEASEPSQRPAYLIIQDYIDAASAEEPQRPAYVIIQDYIDAASAEEPHRPAGAS